MPSPKHKVPSPPPSGGAIRQHALQLLARLQGLKSDRTKKKKKKDKDEDEDNVDTTNQYETNDMISNDEEAGLPQSVPSYDDDSSYMSEQSTQEDYRERARKVLDQVGPYGMPQPLQEDNVVVVPTTHSNAPTKTSAVQTVVPQSRQRRRHVASGNDPMSSSPTHESKDRRRHGTTTVASQHQPSDVSIPLVVVALVSLMIVAIILFWR